MKTNELRIGNKVLHNSEVLTVHKISPDKIYVIHNNGAFAIVNAEALNPAPLTVELLLECGFEQVHGGFYKNSVNLTYGRSTRGTNLTDLDLYLTYNCWLVSKRRVESVHQLQNLYCALTGEELKLEV